MSNARNLANLLGAGTTIATASIADDAITAAKIDDDGAGFTFGDINVAGAVVGDSFTQFDKLKLDGSSVATVTVNSAVSASATIVVDGVSGTIAVGMVVNVSDTTVRSITDAASQSAISVDDTLTITAVASQTSFTVSEAVTIADNVVLILRADESENFVLDASAASTDVGGKIQFEDATGDGSIVTDNFSTTPVLLAALSNTTTIKSEGGAVTYSGQGTTNIAQGLAKVWFSFDMADNSDYALDTFNSSAGTDHGAGNLTITFTNDMANINYSASQMTSMQSDARELNVLNFAISQGSSGGTAPAAGSLMVQNNAGANAAQSGTPQDPKRSSVTVHGDLA